MIRKAMDRRYCIGDRVRHGDEIGEVVNVIPGDRDTPAIYGVQFASREDYLVADKLAPEGKEWRKG